jgi:hypothetical protein
MCYIYHQGCLHPLSECINADEQEPETSWSPWKNTNEVYTPYCKRPGEIDWSKRVCMLHSLLLVELTLFTLGDDFHRIILSCRPVESVPEYFSNYGTPRRVRPIDSAVNIPK